eukprot:scaffold20439_cov136-Isochrysis_galbana.AAC.6
MGCCESCFGSAKSEYYDPEADAAARRAAAEAAERRANHSQNAGADCTGEKAAGAGGYAPCAHGQRLELGLTNHWHARSVSNAVTRSHGGAAFKQQLPFDSQATAAKRVMPVYGTSPQTLGCFGGHRPNVRCDRVAGV